MAATPPPFHRLLDQIGPNAIVFTRRQALAAGLTEHQLRRLVAKGLLAKVGPNAFRGTLIEISDLARLRFLIADVGDPVWVSGPTAAWLHGFDGYGPRSPMHLTVPRRRQVHRPGAIIHTHSHPLGGIDRTTVFGLPIMSPARTLIDLARHENVHRLTKALDAGLRDGKFTEASLMRRIGALRGPGRHGVRNLLDAINGADAIRGGHSFLERAFLQLLDRHGLPKPTTQAIVGRNRERTVRVDFEFPGTAIVVEVLGVRYHRSAEQIKRDTERLNQLIIDGRLPFQYTFEHVMDEGDAVIDELRRALEVSRAA